MLNEIQQLIKTYNESVFCLYKRCYIQQCVSNEFRFKFSHDDCFIMFLNEDYINELTVDDFIEVYLEIVFNIRESFLEDSFYTLSEYIIDFDTLNSYYTNVVRDHIMK